MFLKLLKYDLKALKKHLLTLSVVIFGCGVASCISGIFLKLVAESDSNWITLALSVGLQFFTTSLFYGIFIADFIGMVLILVTYFKSIGTDEAYLNFTLPVTADQFLLSKLLSGIPCLTTRRNGAWRCATPWNWPRRKAWRPRSRRRRAGAPRAARG